MSGPATRWVSVLIMATCLLHCARAAVPPAHPPPRQVLRYRLEPGDRLAIKVFNQPDLDQEVPIRPDGRISLSPLGDVQAAGLTVEQLDASVTAALARQFKAPRVTIFVREFANQNVYVGGEVDDPGLVPLRDGMTSVMAIFQAGGFLATAQRTNVLVLRDVGEGRAEVMRIDLENVLGLGRPDLVLEPYDVVLVPRSKIARVNLFVAQYIRGVLPFDLSASLNYVYTNALLVAP